MACIVDGWNLQLYNMSDGTMIGNSTRGHAQLEFVDSDADGFVFSNNIYLVSVSWAGTFGTNTTAPVLTLGWVAYLQFGDGSGEIVAVRRHDFSAVLVGRPRFKATLEAWRSSVHSQAT